METDTSHNYQTAPVAATAPNKVQSLLIPIAIVVGFGLIAAAIFFSGGNNTPQFALEGTQPTENNRAEPVDNGRPEAVSPVTEDDWVRGDPNAPIVIIEYSDFNCGFCGQLHDTMKQVINDYGTNGQVAWVYRQFPVLANSAQLSLASECVGHLGGNEAFWTFSDLLFENQREITNLPGLAEQAGVSETDFNACMLAETYAANVEADSNNAIATGGSGTPHNIVVVGDQAFAVSGAQPYEAFAQIIENLLTQIEG